jgi:glycosyltransferase involved in cell wall biosynthesis
MSIVVLESGICSKPVLLTDQCGFDSVQEVGGGIVTPATIEGIEAGLDQLLCSEVNLTGMGRRLHNNVDSRFRWSDVAVQYIGLYNVIMMVK